MKQRKTVWKRKLKKDDKGFSLVELIIVIAIMVALIAVMAPNFVKYVQKSHDAVMTAAAEDILAFTKTEFGAGNLNGKGTIKVCAEPKPNGQGKHISMTFEPLDGVNTLSYIEEGASSGSAGDGQDLARFKAASGVDENKSCKSNLAYYISVDNTISSHPTLEVESSVEDNG